MDEAEGKPLTEHLDDLRVCIIRSGLALAAGVCVAMPLAPKLMAFIVAPLEQAAGASQPYLRSLEVTGAFSLWMRLAVWAGVLLAMPFLIHAVTQFVFPGLTSREKRIIKRYGAGSILLFVFGVYLGYRALPLALKAMMVVHDYMHVRAEWTITSYVPFAMQVLLGFGLVFQMPVILLILGSLGLISSKFLRDKWRHVYVLIFIIAAVLTPPDVVSQLVMAAALVGLYEASIVIMRITERRRGA